MRETDPSRAVYLGLKRAGINFAASVPCVNLGPLLRMVTSDEEIIHIPVTREEEGVGICAGAWMGGKSPALIMQNSGLGNSINALASLDFLYEIPLLMVVSHRGCAGETIVGQVPMGVLTPVLLEAMKIQSYAPHPMEAESVIAEAWRAAEDQGRPAAVLLDLRFWRGA